MGCHRIQFITSLTEMRLLPICYLLVIGGIFAVSGRSRKDQKSRRVPHYRSLNDMVGDEATPITSEAQGPLVKSRNNDAAEGRLFKHLLLFKSLKGSDNNSNNGYVPYVIVNSPATLTNVNSNIITNFPTTGTTGTGTTTGTTTGTGGGTGTGAGGGGGVRQKYGNNKNPLAYAVPGLPTPIYHQRNQPMPQVIYGPPLMKVNRKKNNNLRRNPFSAIAHNLRRIQFL